MTPNGGPAKCRRCVWGVLLALALAILATSGILGCVSDFRWRIPGIVEVESGSAARTPREEPPVDPVPAEVPDGVDEVPDPPVE